MFTIYKILSCQGNMLSVLVDIETQILRQNNRKPSFSTKVEN